MKKLTKKQIIITVVLVVLALAAVAVAVFTTVNNKDVPAFDDNTEQTQLDTKEQTTKKEDTTIPETDAPVPGVKKFINPLTGVEVSEEMSKMRPASFMINNIREAIPQQGISKLDVLYECLAEGGITRLLMLVQDYKSLGVTGSVRSSRDYYLDFAQNHDALYFHAGGSDKAYSEIASRHIDNFDGVGMSIPNAFYRDAWRKSQMALEHTMVITGQGVQNAIAYRNARTELKEGFESPFKFADEVVIPGGEDANCVYLPFSNYQTPYLKYDATNNTYKRWQYGVPHIDKDTNTQLEFTNIIVLFCPHTGPLDYKNRIEVTTTGTGEGYYISGGKYINIKFSKENEDAPLKLFNTDDTPLEINVGKSYIAIMKPENKGSINMNYNK